MQPWDEGVLAELCALLPPEPAEMAWDYWGHNEAGLAFETAMDQLSEDHVPIGSALRRRVAETAAYSERVQSGLRFCPDPDQLRWRVVEGSDIPLPGADDIAWLACNRCPEVLFRFDSYAATMGKVPYRCGVVREDGDVTVFTDAVTALDHLERCWS